jgi:sterol desaturase/sphingolipid hydroxylase (fatty acid hydroxylase superfamily)
VDFDKIRNKGQARLFRNDYIEMLTKTHPLVIYSIYFPVIVFTLYYGHVYRSIPALTETGFFLSGLLTWTLFEYAIHRFLFHYLAESRRGKKIIYAIHGVHHQYPRDKERLFMPPVPSIIIASVFFLFFYNLMGVNSLGFFPGFILGYLIYGSMHFAIHAYAPPRFLKALWRNHHLHHYKCPDKGFGVSSVLWDVVFRSMPDKETIKENRRTPTQPLQHA